MYFIKYDTDKSTAEAITNCGGPKGAINSVEMAKFWADEYNMIEIDEGGIKSARAYDIIDKDGNVYASVPKKIFPKEDCAQAAKGYAAVQALVGR